MAGMVILSHRGFWLEPQEKNTTVALERSRAEGFGTETDVRDLGGRLVISHDPPVGGEIGLSDLLDIFAGSGLTLAINIKADGLSADLGAAFAERDIPWFAFDMSGPETVRYLAAGLPVFTRHSDVEPAPICYEQSIGVWLDAFHGDWFGPADVRAHLDAGKRVCIVSPDLHGRSPQPVWDWLKASGLHTHPRLSLCTDFPTEARDVFSTGG
ncbi:MAG: hypothetical protein KDA64_02925 [Rhodospirillaceae bacterium]|nr:hypothetical protein [Rhodospirillaceae bacterium]